MTYRYATTSYETSAPHLHIYQRKYVPTIGDNFDNHTVSGIYSWPNMQDTKLYKSPKQNNSTSIYTKWDTANIKDAAGYNSGLRFVIGKVTVEDEIAPTNLNNWFFTFRECKSFVGLENIDTSKATSMYRMFGDAHYLKDSDLKKLVIDTTNATNFREMFYNCYDLTNADGKTFNFVTENSPITNCAGMFKECSSLQKIDLSNFVFDTNGVCVAWMFRECNALTDIVFPQGTITVLTNTLKNTTTNHYNDYYGIDCMFFECTALEVVDLSFIQPGASTEVRASATFGDCTNLKTIYVSESLGPVTNTYHNRPNLANNQKNDAHQKDIFTNCPALEGGNGTTWQDMLEADNGTGTYITGTYAVIDKEGQQGYFTAKQ